MRQFPHIKRNHRSGNWVYFRRYPASALEVTGSTFFERSLRTADRRKIFEAWQAAHKEFEAAVAQAVAGSQSAIGGHQNAPLRQDGTQAKGIAPWDGRLAPTTQQLALELQQVQALIHQWGEGQRYDRAQRLLNDPEYRNATGDFEAECRLVGACGHTRDWLVFNPKLLELTMNLLDAAGVVVPPWHGALYTIERMVEAELRLTLQAEDRWRQFDLTDMPSSRPARANTALAPNGEPYLSLLDLIETYIRACRKPIKTASKLRLVGRYINDIAQKNIASNELSKQILIELQLQAAQIPARQTAKERKLSITELAENCNNQTTRAKLTPQAVRSWFNILGGCLNWAVNADLLSSNPARGIKPKISPMERSDRKPFKTEDLINIFDPNNSPSRANAAQYWIPLIALYSGARLNEIGQLLKSDIVDEEISHIIIDDRSTIRGVSKRIKNTASRRLIPIHPALIKLGFIDFVRRQDTIYLFPDLPHGSIYEPTKAFSQWFGRYIRKIGIEDRAKVFHSFRHTFKDACRLHGIEEEIHDAITGHTNSKHVGRSYGSGVPLPILKSNISRISYSPGVPPA